MTESKPRPDDELLQEALELPPEAREAFLREACENDPARLENLLSLASAHDRAGRFLDESLVVDPDDLWIGRRVGSFEITGLLGHGGSGRVYEANRAEGDFDQRVAVKLLRRSIDVAEDRRRFKVECEALARLDHPNIAHLIDAGITDESQPYLIIELIDGVDLIESCDARQLGISDRLRLFQEVCGAVDYAHRNLVIHRDLKPGNILVTSDGRPKLLDFGIAKLLSEEESIAEYEVTQTRHVRLTPRYASPEQLAGRPISTLSDVYSLGIVLYELITGKPPYRVEGSSSREWEEAVQSTTILRPSLVIDQEASSRRGATPASLRRRLSGDLDNILLKAMHRDPEQRYRSPGALAEDLERHRSGLPVRARPDTLRYRFSKFARRNRLALSAGSIAGLAVLAAAIVSSVAFFDVRNAQTEAESQRQSAERTVEFLQGMIASIDPEANQSSEDVTVQEMLEGSEARIDEELSDQPLVAARLHSTLGAGYQHLRSMERAEHSFARALEIRERELGLEHPETVAARVKFGKFLIDKGDLEAGQSSLELALEHAAGLPEQTRITPLAALGDVLARRGEFEDAVRYGEEAVRIAREAGDEEDLAYALNQMGLMYTRVGKPAESIAVFHECVDLMKRIRPDDHSEVGQVINSLGFSLKMAGREAEARPHLEEALGIFERVFGPDHTKVAVARSNLGDALTAAGEFGAAEEYHRAAIASFERTLGPEHPYTGHATNSLGMTFLMSGDYSSAVPVFEKAARIYATGFGDDHVYVGAALHNLARCQRRAGDLEAALATGERVWDIRSGLPEDHPDVARSSEFMGRIMMDLDQPAQAEPWFRRSANIRRELYQEDNPMRIDAERELGICLQELGRYKEAEDRLTIACAAFTTHFGAADERTVACEEQLQRLYEQWGRTPGAD